MFFRSEEIFYFIFLLKSVVSEVGGVIYMSTFIEAFNLLTYLHYSTEVQCCNIEYATQKLHFF